MPTLSEIFKKLNVILYQNESLDLDHYYQEPYQDENDEIKEIADPFETDTSRKVRKIDINFDDRTYSSFSFFMDGSRRTYKIGDMIIDGKKIYPVVVAQIRAGCTERDRNKKLHSYGNLMKKNLLLVSDKLNDVDFLDARLRIINSSLAQKLKLEVVKYHFDPLKDNVPVNAAIAKANSMMHDMEIDILTDMVGSRQLKTDKMLIVDGPLQFLRQDTRKPEFADLFYNVVGVSKSFDPMMPTSSKAKRGGTHIGAELLKLDYGQRTPVFLKENSVGRRFGCWYLRIRPINRMSNPLQGIIKVEKMAGIDDDGGLNSSVVDNISLSLLNESSPTCYGRDERWPSHELTSFCQKGNQKTSNTSITIQSWQRFRRLINNSINNDIFEDAKSASTKQRQVYLSDEILNINGGEMVVVDIAGLTEQLQCLVFGDIIRSVYSLKHGDFETGDRQSKSPIPKTVIVFVDELNKYAPTTSTKGSPLLSNLLDITERGRSEGVVLFSAEQFRSAVHDRIKGNCGTNVYGRTNAIEVSRPDYKFVPSVYANMMTRLNKGDLIIQHPVFKTLLKIKFPYPSYKQGGNK